MGAKAAARDRCGRIVSQRSRLEFAVCCPAARDGVASRGLELRHMTMPPYFHEQVQQRMCGVPLTRQPVVEDVLHDSLHAEASRLLPFFGLLSLGATALATGCCSKPRRSL